MEYYFKKELNLEYEKAIEFVTEALKKEGFGIVSIIDVKDVLKAKLGIDMEPYVILGACNPNFAYKALEIDPMVGVFLPCNVIIREKEKGKVEVGTINPLVQMETTKRKELLEISIEVEKKLKNFLESL